MEKNLGQRQDGKPGDALQRVRDSLLRARHLPGEYYTSQEIFDLEVQNIFMKEWLCVARVEEFEKPGDYLATRILGESVLICRDRDNNLQAFRNMCRHRGVEVAAPGSGNKKRFTCPYHAWTYDLTGKLIGAARVEEVDNFDFKSCRLPPLKVDTWGGYVFINFDPDSGSLADHLDEDGVRDFASFIQPERTRTCDKYVFEVNCNWKFVPENVVDMYHVGVIHASSFGGKNFTIEDIRFNLTKNSYNVYYRSDTSAPGGATLFRTMPWIEGKVDAQFAATAWVCPNLTIFARHDLIQPVAILPIDVNRTQVTVFTQIPSEFFDDPAYTDVFDENVRTYADFIRLVLGEDTELLESLHNAARSQGYEPGPLVNLERGIHQLLNYWLDKVVGPDEDSRKRRLEEAAIELKEAEKRYGGPAWDPTARPSRYDAVIRTAAE